MHWNANPIMTVSSEDVVLPKHHRAWFVIVGSSLASAPRALRCERSALGARRPAPGAMGGLSDLHPWFRKTRDASLAAACYHRQGGRMLPMNFGTFYTFRS